MIYVVKAEKICTTYIGTSFKEAQEVYGKCRVSCSLFKLETGTLVPIAEKEMRFSNPIGNSLLRT
jgi:hypothetical protein